MIGATGPPVPFRTALAEPQQVSGRRLRPTSRSPEGEETLQQKLRTWWVSCTGMKWSGAGMRALRGGWRIGVRSMLLGLLGRRRCLLRLSLSDPSLEEKGGLLER